MYLFQSISNILVKSWNKINFSAYATFPYSITQFILLAHNIIGTQKNDTIVNQACKKNYHYIYDHYLTYL